MKRKSLLTILFVVIFAVLLVALTSCGPYHIQNSKKQSPSKLVDKLGIETAEGDFANWAMSEMTTLASYVDGNYVVNYFRDGFYLIRDEEGKLGLYSAAAEKLIATIKHDSINFRSAWDGGDRFSYFILETAKTGDNEWSMISLSGEVLYSVKAANEFDVTYKITEIDNKGEAEVYGTVDVNDGKLKLYYKINDDGSVVKVDQIPTVVEEEESVRNFLDAGVRFGLKNHYYSIDAYNGLATVTFFNNNKKEVSRFIQYANITAFIPIDGKIIYQTEQRVPDDAKRYTYSDAAGRKFLLATNIFDIAKGKTKKIKFNYVINTLPAANIILNDDKGFPKYAVIDLSAIKNRIPVVENAIMVINSKCEFIMDAKASHMDFNALTKLSSDRYLYESWAGDKLLDQNFREIVDLSVYWDYMVDVDEGLIILDDKGLYGVIDFNGKLVVPFEYTSGNFGGIFMNFNGGYAYGLHSDKDVNVCVKSDKTIVEAPSKLQAGPGKKYYVHLPDFILGTEGLLLSVEGYSIDENDIFKVEILDYSLKVLKTFFTINEDDWKTWNFDEIDDEFGNDTGTYILEAFDVVKNINSGLGTHDKYFLITK